MEDELNLEALDHIESNAEEKLKVKNRFEKLSEKVILTAKEKEEVEAKYKAETEARTKAEKERDFFRDFSKLSSQFPNATEYQDKIWEKVNTGYTPEDATLAILAKEGKLQPITAGTFRPDNVAGGSASNTITDSSEKNPNEMSRDELRNALMEAEKQGVNLFRT